MNLIDRLTVKFMQQMTRTPQGRVHFLTQVADAENNDEGKVFEALKERAKVDPELARMVQRHAADEERHGAVLRERALATGLPLPTVPDALKLLHRLDEALGGFFFQPLSSDEDVMRMYLLLQVIEERAVTQMPIFIEGLRESDPESAKVFEQIISDEERHLKYCQAISRRYAPSAEVHEQTLRHFRRVEAKVFAQNSKRNMRYALDHGFLEISFAQKLVWRAIGVLADVVGASRPTPFMDQPLQPALAGA